MEKAKELLLECLNFIDFIKLELGEDVDEYDLELKIKNFLDSN